MTPGQTLVEGDTFFRSLADLQGQRGPAFAHLAGTDRLMLDPDGSGAEEAVRVATLSNHHALGVSDFVFV